MKIIARTTLRQMITGLMHLLSQKLPYKKTMIKEIFEGKENSKSDLKGITNEFDGEY